MIGVHSAKFPAENQAEGILSAIARHEIKHPVIHDRDMRLWSMFGINSWPSFLLIGADGEPLGRAAGEGKALLIDQAIAKSLDRGLAEGTLASTPAAIEMMLFPDPLLKFPGKIALDSSGENITVADSGHNRILLLESRGQSRAAVKSTIGSGQRGFLDGPLERAEFNYPQGIYWHQDTLYIADTGNHAIRSADLKTREVKTLAGNGEQAPWMSPGGYGPASSLNSPWDLLRNRDYLYIAMAGSHQLWSLDLNTLITRPFAGSGTENILDGNALSAQLAQPSGICFGNGSLYFADSEASAIRSAGLDNGHVRTLLGEDLFVWGHRDGSLNKALMQHPLGIDFHDDMLYIADTYNHAIRAIDLRSRTVQTLLGEDAAFSRQCSLENQNCLRITLNEPGDVKYASKRLWIADTGNHLIRCYNLASGQLDDLEIE